MRRRVAAVEDSATVPARLARFRVEDWTAEVGPPPAWWTESLDGWTWFKCRLLHVRACAAYQREHAVTRQEWDQARGACGPDCGREYPHWHG